MIYVHCLLVSTPQFSSVWDDRVSYTDSCKSRFMARGIIFFCLPPFFAKGFDFMYVKRQWKRYFVLVRLLWHMTAPFWFTPPFHHLNSCPCRVPIQLSLFNAIDSIIIYFSLSFFSCTHSLPLATIYIVGRSYNHAAPLYWPRGSPSDAHVGVYAIRGQRRKLVHVCSPKAFYAIIFHENTSVYGLQVG